MTGNLPRTFTERTPPVALHELLRMKMRCLFGETIPFCGMVLFFGLVCAVMKDFRRGDRFVVS